MKIIFIILIVFVLITLIIEFNYWRATYRLIEGVFGVIKLLFNKNKNKKNL